MTSPDRPSTAARFWTRTLDGGVLQGRRARLLALGSLVAVVVWLIAYLVFPHHTINHDEAVYLQQASMLLEGQVFLDPPVDGAFRPWFFVESDAGLYPKYTPPTAAVFAIGGLLGEFRIVLGAIAACCVVLTQIVVAETFDERTGWVAALLFLTSPLFLIQASVFLPYIPALLWLLAFAAAYLRADRTGRYRYGALAGVAIGIAFFARPYTAVLFAAPFVIHALWTLRTLEQSVVLRQGLTAVGGLVGVVITLSYNAYVTGDPLVFPYEAFAPLDGIGFGRREIVGYSREYTPELALRTTVESLSLLGTQWVVAGILGSLAALGGFAVALGRGFDARQATLAGVAPSVTVGFAYFWGPLNALGDLGNPADGLAATLGPYYHVSLLLPVAAFGAVGVLALVDRLRAMVARRVDGPRTRRVAVAALAICAVVFGAAGAVAAAGPIADNAAVSERLGAAYEPVDEQEYDDAVVFLPTPYGDWLNHPFQEFRNDPGYEDGPVYALHDHQFEVIDAFPDRSYHRYAYRGSWSPTAGDPVEAHVQPVDLHRGDRVVHTVGFGVPEYAERVSFRVTEGGESGYVTVPVGDGAGGDQRTVNATIAVDADAARLTAGSENASVAIGDRETIEVRAFVDYGTGAGYAYRIELPVEAGSNGVRTLTPILEYCDDAFTCDGEAAYVPGSHPEHVRITHEVTADG